MRCLSAEIRLAVRRAAGLFQRLIDELHAAEAARRQKLARAWFSFWYSSVKACSSRTDARPSKWAVTTSHGVTTFDGVVVGQIAGPDQLVPALSAALHELLGEGGGLNRRNDDERTACGAASRTLLQERRESGRSGTRIISAI
jgi:hypothetical protein